MTAVAPAFAASSTPSGNGKKASDATTVPCSGDCAFITASHLAGADAEGRTVAREDDGVGLHVFADFPGEAHVLHFFWRGRSLGDGAQLGIGDFAEVWLLNEHASGDALELKLAVRFEAAGRQFEEAKIFLSGKNGFCFFVETWGGNAFREKL